MSTLIPKTDTERLDWLAQQGCIEIVHICGLGRILNAVTIKTDEYDLGKGENLRAAIDDAIREETPEAVVRHVERQLHKAKEDVARAERDLAEARARTTPTPTP